MKKKITPALILVLVIVGYFVFKQMRQGEITTDINEPSMEEGVEVIENEDGSFEIEGFDGVDVSFEEVKDPGVPQPKIKGRNTAGLSPSSIRLLRETEMAIEVNPLSVDDWVLIGGLWKSGGDYSAAVEAWEYVLALTPENYVAANNLGQLYLYDIRDLNKSEGWFSTARSIAPKYVPTYFNMAELYLYGFKDRSKAIAIVEAGIKELPLDESLKSLVDALKSGDSI